VGVFRGTIQYTRFVVDGDLPSDWIGNFEASLKLRRFVPLHEEGSDVESQGFALAQAPFDDDAEIFNDAFYFDGRIILAFRRDTVRLPKAYMKELVKKRIEEMRQKLGEEPPRKTCKAIEESVIFEVRKRVFPKSQIVDLCWDIEKKHLRLFGRGKSLIENFTTLFEQTFSLKIRPLHFAEQAMGIELPLRDKGHLETLVPQELYQPTYRVEV
jgi:DNA recombination-dependent growth factor C